MHPFSYRAMLGRWLLKPLLIDELELALGRHKQVDATTYPAMERYWMGRATSVRRILDGNSTAPAMNREAASPFSQPTIGLGYPLDQAERAAVDAAASSREEK